MTGSFKNRFLFLPALLLAAHVCWGQMPSGTVTIAFDPETAPVWDLGGPYGFQHQAETVGGLDLSLVYGVSIYHDERGRLSGDGLVVTQIGTYFVSGEYRVSGRVYSKDGGTRAVFSVKVTGSDTIAGAQRKFVASLKYDCDVHGDHLELRGTARGSVSVSGLGAAKIDEEVALPLPPGVNGSWSITMDVIALEKIGGRGVISIARYLSPDTVFGDPITRDLPAELSGSYSESRGTTKIRVTGDGAGRGNSVYLELANEPGSAPEPVEFKATLLGQKLVLND